MTRNAYVKRSWRFDMKLIVLCLLATLVANAQTAKPTYPVQDEIRAVFVRFVAAQNAHDGDTSDRCSGIPPTSFGFQGVIRLEDPNKQWVSFVPTTNERGISNHT